MTWLVNENNQRIMQSSSLVGKLHTAGKTNAEIAIEIMKHEKIREGESYYGSTLESVLAFVNQFFHQPMELWYFSTLAPLSGRAGFVIITGNIIHGMYANRMS